MDDVHVGVVHQVAPVMVGLEFRAEALLSGLQRVVQVLLVHIADRHEAAALVAGEMQAGHADTTGTDDAARHLVTRRDDVLAAAHRTENLPRQHREQGHARRRLLDKTSSGFTHSVIVYVIEIFFIRSLQPAVTHLTNLEDSKQKHNTKDGKKQAPPQYLQQG